MGWRRCFGAAVEGYLFILLLVVVLRRLITNKPFFITILISLGDTKQVPYHTGLSADWDPSRASKCGTNREIKRVHLRSILRCMWCYILCLPGIALTWEQPRWNLYVIGCCSDVSIHRVAFCQPLIRAQVKYRSFVFIIHTPVSY